MLSNLGNVWKYKPLFIFLTERPKSRKPLNQHVNKLIFLVLLSFASLACPYLSINSRILKVVEK